MKGPDGKPLTANQADVLKRLADGYLVEYFSPSLVRRGGARLRKPQGTTADDISLVTFESLRARGLIVFVGFAIGKDGWSKYGLKKTT